MRLSSYFIKENVNYEIVGGSDPLVSAFTNATHDIIVAPVNLGAKLYKANGNYIQGKLKKDVCDTSNVRVKFFFSKYFFNK